MDYSSFFGAADAPKRHNDFSGRQRQREDELTVNCDYDAPESRRAESS